MFLPLINGTQLINLDHIICIERVNEDGLYIIKYWTKHCGVFKEEYPSESARNEAFDGIIHFENEEFSD